MGTEPSRVEEYKGTPILVIPMGRAKDGKEYTFAFGLKKARAILEYLEDIRDFVRSEE